MNELTRTFTHKKAVLSLYRNLLRLSKVVNNAKVPQSILSTNLVLVQELEVAKINPSQYTEYLCSDIIHCIRQQFKRGKQKKSKDLQTKEFATLYSEGVRFLSILEDLSHNCNENDSNDNTYDDSFCNLLSFFTEFRQRDFNQRQRKAQTYFQNGIQEFDGKLPEEDLKISPWPLKPIQTLQNHEREKRLKQELETSAENKHKILRRYLKHLQMKNALAVPQLLPYTNLNLPAQNIKLSSKIFKSTSFKAINLGYNLKLVESILIPELEFNVNFHHFLKPLEEVINQKGPFQVKIRQTNAGAVGIPFVKLPTPQLAKMREIAMDIKKLAKDFTLYSLWESSKDDIASKERKNQDGSFSIGWFIQYGPNAKMFSKDVHERLYQEEALWEFFLDKELIKTEADTRNEKEGLLDPSQFKHDLQLIQKSYKNSWMEVLNTTSEVLHSNWQGYYKKYDSAYLKGLHNEQQKYQKLMNSKFQLKVDRYGKLLTILNKHNVSTHSDLISSKTTKSRIDHQLFLNDIYIKKTRMGISESERRGLHCKLADYMDKANIPSYKIGMNYKKRFKF